MMNFVLDPRLAADTLPIGHLPLSRLSLMNDCQYPWAILVPAREGAHELFDLVAIDQQLLMREIIAVATAIDDVFRPTKVNVGALGNIVRQLHVHVVGRFETDPAWPGPVWGKVPAQPYLPEAAKSTCARLIAALVAQPIEFRPSD